MNQVEFDPILVHEWLRRTARRFPDKEALICGKQRWTYKSIDQYSDYLAMFLCDIQVFRQDRVVILLDNSSETVISLYGILKAGGVFVILSGSVKGPKLRYIFENSEATVLITHTSKAKVVMDALDQRQQKMKIIWIGPKKQIPENLAKYSISWDDIFANSRQKSRFRNIKNHLPCCIDVDLAALIYTSGSTGEPKAVMATHHNMISAARSVIQYINNEPNDRILNVLTLDCSYGLYQIIMAFMYGGTIVLEQSFAFPYRIIELISQEQITAFPVVPTIVAMLLKMRDISSYDLSTLRYITSAGAALPVEHIRHLQTSLPHVKIISMYGQTECKRISYLNFDEINRRPDSVGKAMPNCEVFVVDESDKEVSVGQTGELIIRGSNVTQGYWKDPELTARTYRNRGYKNNRMLYTGDYFRKDDDGFLYFLGRKDDMIKSRGERISPKEIENIIYTMDGVIEVIAIGVPDEILGQAIKVYIEQRNSYELTEKDIKRYCAENMETFMVPKYVEFLDELPKTSNGKIDKKQLKDKEIQPV